MRTNKEVQIAEAQLEISDKFLAFIKVLDRYNINKALEIAQKTHKICFTSEDFHIIQGLNLSMNCVLYNALIIETLCKKDKKAAVDVLNTVCEHIVDYIDKVEKYDKLRYTVELPDFLEDN